MAMQIASDGDDEVVSAINTTPLVDVMLVLLIIFLITIPVVAQTVGVKLPTETNLPLEAKPDSINISVTKDGTIYWNLIPVKNTDALVAKLKEVAKKPVQPAVNIRGDQEGNYEAVGSVVFACQRAGILKIGFIAEPPVRG